MSITVIGESNIDIAVVPHSEPIAKGCGPGSIAFHHGGVARNIAHNLCLLGHEIRLATVFGGDNFAQNMMNECDDLGIDISLSTQFKDERSPIFLSFNDELGNMQSAVSDVGLNNHLDLEFVKSKIDEINRSEIVVTDTLLTTEALAFLIDSCTVPLFIDTVSPVKAQRLTEAMEKSKKDSLFALKCNFAEAIAITGKKDPTKAAKTLSEKGIHHVYLTLGSDGAIYYSDKQNYHFSAFDTEIINVTGSGDAFLAGVVFAHSLGFKGKAAVSFGLKVAQHNIKSETPVNPTLRPSIFRE